MRNARWRAAWDIKRRTEKMSESSFGEIIMTTQPQCGPFLIGSFTAHKKISQRKANQRSGLFGTILTEKKSSCENLKKLVLPILAGPMRTFSQCGMGKCTLRRVPRDSKPCAASGRL